MIDNIDCLPILETYPQFRYAVSAIDSALVNGIDGTIRPVDTSQTTFLELRDNMKDLNFSEFRMVPLGFVCNSSLAMEGEHPDGQRGYRSRRYLSYVNEFAIVDQGLRSFHP